MRNFFTIACVLIVNLACAQGVAKKSVVIGTMTEHPNALLILNPPNNDQGILLPQLNSVQRLSIQPQSPADDGLIVFDTDDNAFYFWKQSQWTKGLGNDAEHQSIQYDEGTHRLTLNLNGGEVDLSTLKELPAVAGQAGKFISTDGSSVTWTSVPAGTLTSIVAGQGLTGGGNVGAVNLAINTDNTSLGVSGSNALELRNGGVTSSKIASQAVTTSAIQPGATNTVLVTDNTGVVKWTAPAIAADNQNLSLTSNILSIDRGTNPVNLNALNAGGSVISGPLNNLVILDNTINSAKIIDGSITSTDLKDGDVNTTDIANNAITTTKISGGTINTVLTTDGTGTVKWIAPAVVTDNQQLSYNSTTQQLSLQNSIAADLSALKELPIVAGNAGKFLATNGTSVTWSDLTAGGQVSGTLGNLVINNNVVKTNNILDGTILGTDLASDIAINTTGNLNVAGTTNFSGSTTVNSLFVSSAATVGGLAGGTTRMVVVNPSGVLSAQTLPAGPTTGNLTTTTSGVTITNGANAVIGSGSSISIQTASASQPGLLSNADYTTFNTKVGLTTTPASGDINGNYNTGFQLGNSVVGDPEISTLSATKISQSGATTGQVLKWNGSAWTPQADASIPTLSANQIVTNDGSTNVTRTINGDATFNGASGALSISTSAGTNIVTAVNNASTTGTINTNRLAPAVVLDSESPTGGSIGGTFASGLTLNNNSVTTVALAPHAVDATKINPGTANQVLVTDGTGTNALWVNQTSLADGSATNELITNMQLSANTLTVTEAGTGHTQNLNGLSLTGDVTGNLNTNKVTKIQGVAVSATAPTDQQVLVYDNSTSQWKATTVPGVSTFVAFKVVQNLNQPVGGTDMLVWDNEQYDDGGNFSGNHFTAPTSGLYHFDVLITIQDLDKNDVVESILRVGLIDVQRVIYSSGSKNNDASGFISTDVKLNAGDIVTAWVNVPSSYQTKGGTTHTQFSGRKIY